MLLATRADLEQVRGVTYLETLLKADGVNTAAEREVRLDMALAEGDLLIAQFLPLERFLALPVDHVQRRVVRKFAVAEALYWLRSERPNGASEGDIDAANLRRTDLAKMRDRGQWPGGPGNQSNIRAESGESRSAFSQRRMRGLT